MENRDYKEEYQKHLVNREYRRYEDTKTITISKVGKTKLNISIHPYLKDEFKNICEKNVNIEIEKFIKQKIEEFYNKKLILK